MNCRDAVAALVASLETATEMSDEQCAHIRTCDRCRALLDSAKQFQTLLAGNGIETPSIDPVLAAAEEEVRRRRQRRAVGICLGILAILGAAVAWLLIASGEVPPPEAFAVVGVSMVFGALALTPLFLVWYFVCRSNRDKPRLYKRLRKGRYLSGVALGLAEATKLNVSLIRAICVLLLFFDGAGFWLYLILDLAMPVHPEDRQHLLRFKVRRWFRRRMAHAENHAG
ncbi:MAG TPA: PspC domain-containing protein [Thermoanaerobaculia bacterium]|jgi:phage shock protein PspC (stress-responsive transcriptional regulator)|nr:PspC domain-containing protein [Thermoanaerobaculia bacterium]